MRAMILAAGRGSRMRPLTDTIPKPLLSVGGKPLIVWHIERLVTAGISRIIINHAWLGTQIESVLGDGRQFGATLHYSAETTALETAGGIARALWFFQDQPFLVINGDIWCDWNPVWAQYGVRALTEHDALAWLLLVSNPVHNPDGDFLLTTPLGNDNDTKAAPDLAPAKADYSTVHLRTDDNAGHHDRCPLTFAGIGLYHPRFFAAISDEKPTPLAPLLRGAIARSQVIGTRYQGEWVDVGTPERLHLLERDLAIKGQARYTSD